jgi:hypothetical protein
MIKAPVAAAVKGGPWPLPVRHGCLGPSISTYSSCAATTSPLSSLLEPNRFASWSFGYPERVHCGKQLVVFGPHRLYAHSFIAFLPVFCGCRESYQICGSYLSGTLACSHHRTMDLSQVRSLHV